MNRPAEVQFNHVADAYATSAVHALGEDLGWLVEAIDPQPDWTVLDVGAGAGHASLAVSPHVQSVTAADVAARMLETTASLAQLRGLTNIRPVLAGAEALPFADRSFDAAFTRYSAHHWSDPRAGVMEIGRTLKRGGRFIMIDTVSFDDPALDTFLNSLELLRDLSHVKNVTVQAWRERLVHAGFTVDSVKTWTVEIETEGWLQRSATAPWRSAACRQLLREGPAAARQAIGVTPGEAAFHLPCAMLCARAAAA